MKLKFDTQDERGRSQQWRSLLAYTAVAMLQGATEMNMMIFVSASHSCPMVVLSHYLALGK